MSDTGRMRVFVAVRPPEEVIDHLLDYLQPRIDAGEGVRWTDPDQIHITLAFMGEAPAGRLDDLVDAVDEAAARRAGFDLALRSVGCFPDVPTARVLWCGVDDPAAALPGLARGIRSACNRVGAAPQGGPFRGHVTVARFHRPTEATRWVRALEPYAGPTWPVTEVAVVESHLGEGRRRRPRYVEHARVPLGQTGA